jgi:glycosyltransferase involved in cell wall biosynthesis
MSSNKVKLIVVQGRVPHYRIPFFNLLARVGWLEVTVLHSGSPTQNSTTAYSEIVVEDRSILGFHFQRSLLDIAGAYDVLIGMFDIRWLTTLAVLLKRQRPRLIWWGIGLGRSTLAKWLRLRLVARSEGLIVYSEGARAQFLERGISHEKVFVAPNTIKVDLPNDNGVAEAKRQSYLFVGSLDARKRIPDLLRAFTAVQDSIPQSVSIDIVGEGAEEQRLRELARELGISERVRFLGRITRDDELRSYFNRALAAISPGQAGLSVLHAFAHGVPFVTSKSAISGGEIENILDGVNGYLYDGSIAQLGQVMLRLATDVSISERLGRNAQLYYRRHRTMDRMVASFEMAVRQAIGG